MQGFAATGCDGKERHTLTQEYGGVAMALPLEQAIKEFLSLPGNRLYATADGALGHCKAASEDFAVFCRENGLAAAVVFLGFPHVKQFDLEFVHEDRLDHLVVGSAIQYATAVEGLIIDFTARQYDWRAPLPLIERPEEARRRWGIAKRIDAPSGAAPLWRDVDDRPGSEEPQALVA